MLVAASAQRRKGICFIRFGKTYLLCACLRLKGAGTVDDEKSDNTLTSESKFAWHVDALNRIPQGELEALCETLGFPFRGFPPQQLVYALLSKPNDSQKEFLSEALLELLPGYQPYQANPIENKALISVADPQSGRGRPKKADADAKLVGRSKASKLKGGFLKQAAQPEQSHQGKKTQRRDIRQLNDPDEFPTSMVIQQDDYDPELDPDLEEAPSTFDELRDTKRSRTDSGNDGQVIITAEMERRLQQEQARSGRFNRYCQYPKGCTRFPYYGLAWDRIPRFCLEHRHDHHLDVRHTPHRIYMGESLNGTRVLPFRNIKVIEDEKDPDDNERLRKAFEPYHDCEKCGASKLTDVYYEFPMLSRRMSLRRFHREMLKETTGVSEPESDPSEIYNTSFQSVPVGPYWTEGNEEWRRFIGTQQGEDLRTNKEVEDAEFLREMYREELKIAEKESEEVQKQWVDGVMNRSLLVQRILQLQSRRGTLQKENARSAAKKKKALERKKSATSDLLKGFSSEDEIDDSAPPPPEIEAEAQALTEEANRQIEANPAMRDDDEDEDEESVGPPEEEEYDPLGGDNSDSTQPY